MVGGRIRKWDGALLDLDLPRVRRLAEESRAYLFDKAGFALSPAGIDGVPELSDPSLRGYLDPHDDEVAGAV
jgi:hypothetical protein